MSREVHTDPDRPAFRSVDVTQIPISELLTRLAQVIKDGKQDMLLICQRVVALEVTIDDALRCLENNDKHGAMGCLRAAKVNPEAEHDPRKV